MTTTTSRHVRGSARPGARIAALAAVDPRQRWRALAMAALATVGLTVATLGTGSVVSAQAGAGSTWTADIREGTCAEPGDIAVLLDGLGGPVSHAGPPAVATSITQVAHPLEALSDGSHIIRLDGESADRSPICGAIGAPTGDMDGSALALVDLYGQPAGVAWLHELGLEATTVHLFVVSDSLVPLEEAPASARSPDPSPSPSPAPSGSPEDGGGLPPGDEIDPGEDIDVDVDGVS